MLLIQLSDIHVGSQFQESVFENVISEVNELKPDAILISGDLTNEGLIKEYEKCKKLISRFNCKKKKKMDGSSWALVTCITFIH